MIAQILSALGSGVEIEYGLDPTKGARLEKTLATEVYERMNLSGMNEWILTLRHLPITRSELLGPCAGPRRTPGIEHDREGGAGIAMKYRSGYPPCTGGKQDGEVLWRPIS